MFGFGNESGDEWRKMALPGRASYLFRIIIAWRCRSDISEYQLLNPVKYSWVAAAEDLGKGQRV
jgi:hypothetical protein